MHLFLCRGISKSTFHVLSPKHFLRFPLRDLNSLTAEYFLHSTVFSWLHHASFPDLRRSLAPTPRSKTEWVTSKKWSWPPPPPDTRKKGGILVSTAFFFPHPCKRSVSLSPQISPREEKTRGGGQKQQQLKSTRLKFHGGGTKKLSKKQKQCGFPKKKINICRLHTLDLPHTTVDCDESHFVSCTYVEGNQRE